MGSFKERSYDKGSVVCFFREGRWFFLNLEFFGEKEEFSELMGRSIM